MFARNAVKEKCIARKNRRRWCGSWDGHRFRQRCLRWNDCRCNGCGEVFTANEPQSAGPEKFDATAVAMTALVKYGTGMPFHRLEQLEKQLGIPFPASTQWELMKRAAGSLWPVLNELIRHAAQGSVMHNDDTGMRILKLVRDTGRRSHGNVYQRHRIDLAGVEDRAVLYRMEACGRKPCRCSETARGRNWMPRFRCATRFEEHAEADRSANPAGLLPGARKTAVCGCRRRASPKNADMCWSRWARFTTTMPRRRSGNCRRKSGCRFIRSTADR